MTEIALGIALFTGTVLVLVLMILLARRVLQPGGPAIVVVNERRRIEASRGDRLLDALAAAGIALPAACGGKGTCGQCRLRVLDPAPPALPTDRARIGARELLHGGRLACQLRLRGDLRVRIPDEIFGVGRWRCPVRSARCVGTMLREIVAELPEGEHIAFRAGSFVQVTAPPYRARFRDFPVDPEVRPEWDRLDLWRHEVASSASATRAYSLANPPAEDRIVMLLVRLATPPAAAAEGTPPGVVSSWLFQVRPGDAIEVAGPYGHFFAEEGDEEMVFVGGGAGMAPLRSHVLHQLETLHTTRRISFWYGARSRRELIYAEELERLQEAHPGFRFVPALSEPVPGEAWQGEVGFIHEVLFRTYLADHPSPEACQYYLCGPPLMARATLAMLEGLGVPSEQIHFDDFGP